MNRIPQNIKNETEKIVKNDIINFLYKYPL